MSQSITNPAQLQDIPLPAEEQAGDSLANSVKVNSKTNSLRRFLKMPHRKTGEEVATSSDTDMPKNSKKNNTDPEAARNNPIQQQKRFRLRVGSGSLRFDGALSEAPSGSIGVDGNNKPTLKSSISNYWNTIFNRPTSKLSKSAKAAADAAKLEQQANAEELEDEDEFNETIHNLTLSDEPKNNAGDNNMPLVKPKSPEGNH